jgi:ATP-dependent Lon protease
MATLASHVFLPVLPLRELCLFPESSLALVVSTTGALKSLEMAMRTGGNILALAQRDPESGPHDLHELGTVAQLSSQTPLPEGGRRVELDGLRRGRALSLMGVEAQVAETELLDDGDAGDDWGPAVEALARYLHAHPDLRSFLDQQRRSREPMAWVNLACQHLPITASARQRLLESPAPERCLKISRGLDALLRKEQAI